MRAPLACAVASLLAAAAAAGSLAACGGPSSARPGSGGDAAGGLDVGFAFAPSRFSTKALDAFEVPYEKAKALALTVPEDERGESWDPDGHDNGLRPDAYDFDRDGTIDLIAFRQPLMHGQSDGWIVFAASGGKLERLFELGGDWSEARIEGGVAMLRFEALVVTPGEPRFLTTLRFAKGAWEPPIRTYIAAQTRVPAPRPPYASFTTRGAAALRATPTADDKPNPTGDDAELAEESTDRTATLRGNVVATYAPGARGTVLASKGSWRYVALDPATKPKETSLTHSMDTLMEAEDGAEDESGDRPANRLLSDAWLCGWIAAAEIEEQK